MHCIFPSQVVSMTEIRHNVNSVSHVNHNTLCNCRDTTGTEFVETTVKFYSKQLTKKAVQLHQGKDIYAAEHFYSKYILPKNTLWSILQTL